MSNSNNNMMPQQYCLRWRYHHSNLQTMFSQLLEREAFCDVTLACDGRTIKAHKIVLSACSTYFDTILSQYEEKDPILIMKDVKFVDIKCLVEFMYKGEINVEHTHLATLLKTAEDLRIKGLAEVSWRDASTANNSSASSIPGGGGNTTANNSNTAASTSASHNGIQHALANVATVMGSSPKEGVVSGIGAGGGTRQQHLLQQQLTMNKRKRGRPPIDDYEQPGYTLAPKIVSVMSGSNAEESASNDDGTSASDHDTETDHHHGGGGGQHRGGEGGSSGVGGGKASGSSQWDDDDVDRINSFGEHMLSGIRVKTELNTEDEYVDYDQAASIRSRTSTNASQLNNSSSIAANNTSSGTPSGAATFSISQLEKEWPDVIRLNDYLNTGRRQQFWEEPFTKRVMDAIKTKNLEMKSAAELLGVSYGTLYGRYRDAYGCLKHPYSLSRSGLLVKVPGSMTPNSSGNSSGGTANWIRDAWSDQGSTDIIMKLKRKEITLFKAAEQLKMTPQALSNYLISFSMGMDPEMANTVAKLLAQQTAEEGAGSGTQASQLQLQLQQMPPLRRLHGNRTNDDDGSIIGDDDDEMEGEDEEEEEDDEEEVVFRDQPHLQQQQQRSQQRHQQQQHDVDDDDEEDSILPDIPTRTTNHHSIIGKPSALANCPDITIIRKERFDKMVGNSRMNNNDHSEQRGGTAGANLKTIAASSSSVTGTAT